MSEQVSSDKRGIIPDRKVVRVEQRTGRDCLRCCVAMVTQVNYEDVPDFCAERAEAWPTALEEWLSMLGMGLLMFGKAAPEYVPSWLPIIAQGRTNRSSLPHFVVITSVAEGEPVTRLTEYRQIAEGLLMLDWILGYELTSDQMKYLDNLRSRAATILEAECKDNF